MHKETRRQGVQGVQDNTLKDEKRQVGYNYSAYSTIVLNSLNSLNSLSPIKVI